MKSLPLAALFVLALSGPALCVPADAGRGKGGSGGADSLGIPMSAPWETASSAKAKVEPPPPPPKHPLEEGFERRLRLELPAVLEARAGLLAALGYAHAHPEVFPPGGPNRPGGLFDEHVELARRLWLFAADHYLALEAVVGRYRDYPALSEAPLREAGFQAACTARLAQRRFLTEWRKLFAQDPDLRRALEDAETPGLPPGLLARLLKEGGEDGEGLLAGRLARSPSRSLAPYLGRGLPAFEKARREDLLRLRARARKGSETQVAAALGVEAPLIARAAAWTPPPPPVPVVVSTVEVEGFQGELVDPLAWLDLPVSSQAQLAILKLKETFDPDPPSGSRPETLVSTRQLADLSALLEPGDVLLLRRALSVDALGLGGWWRSAALYAGTPPARARAFKKDGVEGYLVVENPEALKRNSARWQPADVFWSDGRGVRLDPLLSALCADAVAVLRPRASREVRAQAVRRLFAALGRDPEACAPAGRPLAPSAAAVWAAYAGADLRLPAVEVLDESCASADALARRFDEDYGTEKARFDLIAFLDPRELWQRAVPSPLEEFRSSWRRPAWSPQGTPANASTIATEARP
ncbi:MAG: hypothetical protein WC969_14025 [Elusimicrobiota bacterium]